MSDSPLSPAITPAWMADRLDEHGHGITNLERENVGHHKSQHELKTELRALVEKTQQNDAIMLAQLATLNSTMQNIRDKQIEYEATRKAEAAIRKESRETRTELAGWVRWIGPGALGLLLLLMNLGEKMPK